MQFINILKLHIHKWIDTPIPVRLVSKWRTETLFQAVEDCLRRACCNEVLYCGTNPENIAIFTDASLFSPLRKEYLLAVCDSLAAEADTRFFNLWPVVRRLCGGRQHCHTIHLPDNTTTHSVESDAQPFPRSAAGNAGSRFGC